MAWFKKENIEKENIKEEIESALNNFQEKSLKEIASNHEEIKSLKDKICFLEEKVKELTCKLREQNEADLFLQCEKIKQEILSGKSKQDLADEHNRWELLNNQRIAMQNCNQRADYLGMQGSNAAIGRGWGG